MRGVATHSLKYGESTTDRQDNMIMMTAVIDEVIYLLLLVWTLVNVKRYLVDQKRHKTFSILIFYILAISTEISRLVMYFNQLFIEAKGNVQTSFLT